MNRTVSSGDYIKDADVYLHYSQYWGWPTELPDMKEHFLDEFGITWNNSGKDKDIGVKDNPIISEPDIFLLKEPVLDEKRLRKEWKELLAKKKNLHFQG